MDVILLTNLSGVLNLCLTLSSRRYEEAAEVLKAVWGRGRGTGDTPAPSSDRPNLGWSRNLDFIPLYAFPTFLPRSFTCNNTLKTWCMLICSIKREQSLEREKAVLYFYCVKNMFKDRVEKMHTMMIVSGLFRFTHFKNKAFT